jgi:hypothetical protein
MNLFDFLAFVLLSPWRTGGLLVILLPVCAALARFRLIRIETNRVH